MRSWTDKCSVCPRYRWWLDRAWKCSYRSVSYGLSTCNLQTNCCSASGHQGQASGGQGNAMIVTGPPRVQYINRQYVASTLGSTLTFRTCQSRSQIKHAERRPPLRHRRPQTCLGAQPCPADRRQLLEYIAHSQLELARGFTVGWQVAVGSRRSNTLG